MELYQLNQQFLDLLSQRNISISESFLEMADDFKQYSSYCSSHPLLLSSMAKMRQKESFLELEKKMQSMNNGLDFGSFLIKPIQRICKYPILFKELLRNTSEDHQDFSLNAEAVNKAERVLEFINEEKRRIEKREQLLHLNSKIVGMDSFDLTIAQDRVVELGLPVTNEKAENLFIWVFSDSILWTKWKKGEDSYKYKGHIPAVSLR
eukprot:TRINITY_DN5001_c0_g1_i2.p1 TRINITY_DN5001_c0_g1~~TRINITY_DN5001_c0_g1_i2.p1  ORF type:complete len:207 (+),score=83.49 TRINITY_DN5001_c0_g1_i2:405-1025(+)